MKFFSHLLKKLMPKIDKSGKWWTSQQPDAIGDFLKAYATDGYNVDEFRLAKCTCSSIIFRLEADDNEGVAKRTCTQCKKEHYICDSEEYYKDAEPEKLSCIECKSDEVNVGAGFSLYDDGEIRWIYIGYRCNRCGILGCFAGWKIGYAPSKHLLKEV
jgi:hypothetical protein